MSITIQPAGPSDIPELIDIFFAAFASDSLLMTCYPDTPVNRAFWVRSVQSQMRHPEALVFKAILTESDLTSVKIIGWAKWLYSPPKSQSSTGTDEDSESNRQGALDPTDAPSPDMNMQACNALADGQYKMFEEILGGRGCYWLNAISIHPTQQHLGAATQLVATGTRLADEANLECFAACTDTANKNMTGVFHRAGFRVVSSEEVIGGMRVHGGVRGVEGVV